MWQLIEGLPGSGGPSHGTTGTVVNPALIAYQKCALKFVCLLCLGVHLPAWGSALLPFPINYAQFFFSALGVHVHKLHPLATPMPPDQDPIRLWNSTWPLLTACSHDDLLAQLLFLRFRRRATRPRLDDEDVERVGHEVIHGDGRQIGQYDLGRYPRAVWHVLPSVPCKRSVVAQLITILLSILLTCKSACSSGANALWN